MNTFCAKCKTKTGYCENPKLGRTKNSHYTLVGKFVKCGIKEFTFVSKSDA